MKRLLRNLLLNSALWLLAAGAAAAEPVAVRLALNWKAEPQFGGFYAADVHGAYAANGLAVEIIEGGSGAGEQRFHQALRDAPDVATLLADLRRNGYPPGGQRTYMVARAMSDVEFVVAGALYPEAVRDCKMTPVDTLEEGLAYAQRKLGRDLDVVVVPHALQTLPILAAP